MIENKIIDAMGDLDEALLADAVEEWLPKATLKVRTPMSKRRKAVLVLVAVLAFVITAGFVSGVITSPVTLFNTGKVKTKTYKILYLGKEVEVMGFRTQLNPLKQNSIKGAIKEVAQKQLAEKKERGELHWYPVTDQEGNQSIVYDDYYLAENDVKFSDQDAALEFIGCKSFEKQYFPYDSCQVAVSYSATLPLDASVSRFMLGCQLFAESLDEEIKVKISAEANWNKVTEDIGGKQYYDDGTFALKTFVTPNGYNAGKAYKTGIHDGWVYSQIYSENGIPDNYEVDGLVVKNSCIYRIEISCPWEDRAEADQIFDAWTAGF